MNIFAIIESDHNISISDDISSELSFLNETDKSYDEYMSISNECAMTSAVLYEIVGLEDFKESVKKGFKYVINKILKAILYIGNLFRKLIHKLSFKKTTLILKQYDENMKEYEVAHPEVVDEADKFFSNLNFDSMEEVQYETISPNKLVTKIKDTFLYRVLILSKIVQDDTDFKSNLSKISSKFKNVHFDTNLMREFDVNDGSDLNITKKGSYLNLLKYTTSILKNFSDDISKLNSINIGLDSDVIRHFSESYDITANNKFKAIYDMSVNINKLFNEIYPERDRGYKDVIEAAMQKYGNGKSDTVYLQWKYRSTVFKVVESIEKSLFNGPIQSIIKDYQNITAQLKPLLEKLTKDEFKDYKIIIDNLNNWLTFINNVSNITYNINLEINKLKSTASKYKERIK